jgi:hypothetical protein
MVQLLANHTRELGIPTAIVYTLGVSDSPQRLILLLTDSEGIERRAKIVEELTEADMPFTPAVVGPSSGFAGIREVAVELPDLLARHRPHAVHLSLGHTDLIRRVEADGNSYTSEWFPEIERYLHQAIDAVVETALCELVLTTASPVKDDVQDEVRMSDVERLNAVIRSVAESRDVLVDRLDMVISLDTPPPSGEEPAPVAHLAGDGRSFTPTGRLIAARSVCNAVRDVLLRAEHPWRQMMRGGMGGLDGISRPRHPELS